MAAEAARVSCPFAAGERSVRCCDLIQWLLRSVIGGVNKPPVSRGSRTAIGAFKCIDEFFVQCGPGLPHQCAVVAVARHGGWCQQQHATALELLTTHLPEPGSVRYAAY